MKTIRGIQNVTRFRRPTCLTIGAFDGVHLGHQAVIRRVVEKAVVHGLTSTVLTFDPHPRISLRKDSIPPLLTCTGHKLSLLRGLGVSVALLVELDRDLAAMSARDFVVEILHSKLNAAGVVAGPRLRFGKGRKGTITLLKTLGLELGFWVEAVDEVVVDGVPVSSTMVRRSITRGDLPTAEALLGRRFSISGRVVRGRTIGRKLGYPTANIQPLDEVIPPPGVYAVEVIMNRTRRPGALNLGWRPTFASQKLSPPVLEVHILNFNEPIYRREVEVVFHRRMRDERQFAEPQDLVRQIALDIEAIKRYFDNNIISESGAVTTSGSGLSARRIC